MTTWHEADTISFQGMKRCGNHAVIDWLTDNNPAISHFNNVFPLAPMLEGSACYEFPVPLKRAIARERKWYLRWAPVPAHPLVSIEDFPFARDHFGDAGRTLSILLVRSAESIFASRIHKAFRTSMPAYPRTVDPVMRRAMDIWVDHVESLIENADKPDFVSIVFDVWITDEGYRNAIAQRLGFDPKIPPRASRAKAGGGSSFEGSARVTDTHSLLRRRELLSGEEGDVLSDVLADPAIAHASRALAAFIQKNNVNDLTRLS
jgi:hypothetical protein